MWWIWDQKWTLWDLKCVRFTPRAMQLFISAPSSSPSPFLVLIKAWSGFIISSRQRIITSLRVRSNNTNAPLICLALMLSWRFNNQADTAGSTHTNISSCRGLRWPDQTNVPEHTAVPLSHADPSVPIRLMYVACGDMCVMPFIWVWAFHPVTEKSIKVKVCLRGEENKSR